MAWLNPCAHRGAVAETASPGPLAAGSCCDPVADLRRFARQAGGQGDADPGIFEPGEPRPLGKRPAIGANIRAAEKGQSEPRFPFGAAAAVKIYDVAAGRNVGIVVSHDDGIVSRHVRFQFLAMRSRSGVRSTEATRLNSSH